MQDVAHSDDDPRRAAVLFDGRSAKGCTGHVRFDATHLHFELEDGQSIVEAPIAGLKLAPPGRAPTRRLALPDGSVIELANEPGLAPWLAHHGLAPSFTERLEGSWRWALGAMIVALLLGFGAWRFGIPAASHVIAAQIPPAWEARLGAASVAMLDGYPFEASRLEESRREQLTERFRDVVAVRGAGLPPWELRFRRFAHGPNAFALPGGVIVMTDELVEKAAKAGGDDAILGVLAHELGHVAERHVLRGIVEASLASGLIGVVIGDFSSVLATVPATLLQLSYSREHESDADRFAIDLLHENGLSTVPLAELLEAMHERETPKTGKEDSSLLSSHPATTERLRRLREAR